MDLMCLIKSIIAVFFVSSKENFVKSNTIISNFSNKKIIYSLAKNRIGAQ